MSHETSLVITLGIALLTSIVFYMMAYQAQRRAAQLERANSTLSEQLAAAQKALVDATRGDS
jgi:uncharacterized protein involved in exopolysaccharide biosynthesis